VRIELSGKESGAIRLRENGLGQRVWLAGGYGALKRNLINEKGTPFSLNRPMFDWNLMERQVINSEQAGYLTPHPEPAVGSLPDRSDPTILKAFANTVR